MTWKEYKELIKPTIKYYGDTHFYVLSSGLASTVGDLIKYDFNDCVNNKLNDIPRRIEFGNALWYLAALEIVFNLPDNLCASMFEITINNANLLKYQINAELTMTVGQVIMQIHTGNLQELQYELNDLASHLLDYADFHSLNVQECMKANLMKLDLRKTSGKKQPSIEYNHIKKMIKDSGKEELLLEIKLFKNKYKSLIVSYRDEFKEFNKGDLIFDFFEAINFIDDQYNSGFITNFGPKIRKFLKEQNEIVSGFIINDDLITSSYLKKNGKNAVYGYKPSFFKPSMTKLNHLLDYINDYKKQLEHNA